MQCAITEEKGLQTPLHSCASDQKEKYHIYILLTVEVTDIYWKNSCWDNDVHFGKILHLLNEQSLIKSTVKRQATSPIIQLVILAAFPPFSNPSTSGLRCGCSCLCFALGVPAVSRVLVSVAQSDLPIKWESPLTSSARTKGLAPADCAARVPQRQPTPERQEPRTTVNSAYAPADYSFHLTCHK
jgi:hypothetical protein